MFVNSSCHMCEKRQAGLATGENKPERPLRQPPLCPSPGSTAAGAGTLPGRDRGACARPCRCSASAQDGSFPPQGRPCGAGAELAPPAPGSTGWGARLCPGECGHQGRATAPLQGRGCSSTPELGPSTSVPRVGNTKAQAQEGKTLLRMPDKTLLRMPSLALCAKDAKPGSLWAACPRRCLLLGSPQHAHGPQLRPGTACAPPPAPPQPEHRTVF